MEENQAEITTKPQAPTGIKGWLIAIPILILASAIISLAFMAEANKLVTQFGSTQAARTLAFATGKDFVESATTSMHLSAVFAVMFIAVAIPFFMKKRWVVPVLMLLFGSFAVFLAWNASLWNDLAQLAGGPPPPDPAPRIAFFAVLYGTAIIYLWRSQRVRQTFSWQLAVEGRSAPPAQDDTSEMPPIAKGFVVANWILIVIWYLTLLGWGALSLQVLERWDFYMRSMTDYIGFGLMVLYPVIVILGSRASWRQLNTGRPWRGLALTNSPLLLIITMRAMAVVFG